MPALDSPLLKKVKERNETYVRRWRETQVPALVAGTLHSPETRQKLAELDGRIAQLEAEIQSLRKPN